MSEIVAWATPIYEAVKPVSWRALQRLGFRMARTIPDLWLLDTPSRLTYPFSHKAIVRALKDKESKTGKRADWLFVIEDDIVPEEDTYAKLRAAADVLARPYVSALAYCRTKPYYPGVADAKTVGSTTFLTQWSSAPGSGTVAVDSVAMCAAIFHRSLFDRVEKPWFGIEGPTSTGGMGPDAFWCKRLRQFGIQPYLCCDAKVGHISDGVVITQELAEAWQKQQQSS